MLTMVVYFQIIDRDALDTCTASKLPGGPAPIDFYINFGLFTIQSALLLVTKTNYDFTQLIKHIYIDKKFVNINSGLTEIPSVEWRRQHGRNLIIVCAMGTWVMLANLGFKVLPILTPISLAVMAIGAAIYWHRLDDHVVRLKRKKLLMEIQPNNKNHSSLSEAQMMQNVKTSSNLNCLQKFCASYQMSFEFTKGPAGVELETIEPNQSDQTAQL